MDLVAVEDPLLILFAKLDEFFRLNESELFNVDEVVDPVDCCMESFDDLIAHSGSIEASVRNNQATR